MASSIPGIGRILICDLNKLTADPPVNPIPLGFRGEAKIEATPFKTVKEQGGGELPNMRNFKFEAESYQPTMKMLKSLIGWLNLNADVEVITARQSAGAAHGDVFKFIGDYLLGLGFEYTISGDKRSAKVMFEGAFEEDRALALINTAIDPATVPAVIDGLDNPEGNSFELYRSPYFMSLKYNGADEVQVRDIISRTFTIKTISSKDIYNSDIVNKLEFSLEVVTRNASLDAIKKNLEKGRSLSLVMREKNKEGFYDEFNFAPGALIRLDEFSIGDNERQSKITLKREVSLYDIDFLFGEGNGGDAEDLTGTTGGACMIGY
jgi:hypothetical protein